LVAALRPLSFDPWTFSARGVMENSSIVLLIMLVAIVVLAALVWRERERWY
jgi:hypothetical protein